MGADAKISVKRCSGISTLNLLVTTVYFMFLG